MSETIEIDYLAKVKLEEGDTLVLKLAYEPSLETLDRLRSALFKHFEGKHKVLVLSPGCDVDVLTRAVGGRVVVENEYGARSPCHTPVEKRR